MLHRRYIKKNQKIRKKKRNYKLKGFDFLINVLLFQNENETMKSPELEKGVLFMTNFSIQLLAIYIFEK